MKSLNMRFKHNKIPIGSIKGKKKLDLGCGRKKLSSAIGLDRMKLSGVDVVADLNTPLPFKDEEFEFVHADQVLEHVENLIDLVYEIYRILEPGGIFLAHVPYFRSSWAHVDLTHLHSFTINSMDYFVKRTYCYENYRYRELGFEKIEVFLDIDYPTTIFRRFFTSRALRNPWKFENSIWSNVYPFEKITYLLTK